MRKLVNTTNMDRKTWLAYRQLGLGGSDAGTIIGLNPWQTPMGLFLEKRGEIESPEAGEAAKWGNKLENVIAEEFAEQNPDYKVRRNNFLLQHKKYDFMLGNLDRELYHPDRGKGVLEIKTGSHYLAGEWENNEVPSRYMLQVQHYLAVTGYDYAHIAILIAGQRYHQLEIDRDDEIIEYLYEFESDFWQRIKNNHAPELDGSKASSELLKKLYPQSEPGKEIDLHETALELARIRQEADQAEKAAKLKKTEAENKLKAMLGEAEKGILPDSGFITWKAHDTTRIDSNLLKANYPEIYKAVCKTSSVRKFSLKLQEVQ